MLNSANIIHSTRMSLSFVRLAVFVSLLFYHFLKDRCTVYLNYMRQNFEREDSTMMDVTVGSMLTIVSLLCFFSAGYYNGNGQLGYKGMLFLLSGKKHRNEVYRQTNRMFGILLFLGSLLFIITAKFDIVQASLANIRIAYLSYIFLSMLASDLFTAYKIRLSK